MYFVKIFYQVLSIQSILYDLRKPVDLKFTLQRIPQK